MRKKGFYMKRNNYWYPVDNAGKIFPAVSKDSRSSVFRLSFYFEEEVDKEALELAVNQVLPRFETFAVELKSGMFWNYLSKNMKPVRIRKEDPVICKYVPFAQNNNYMFTVYYYGNKVTLETFHSISDGTGAMEFLKSIVYQYFMIKKIPMDHESLIMGQRPFDSSETTDMFCSTYDRSGKKALKEEPAYHIQGEKFRQNYSVLVRIKCPTDELLRFVKTQNVTLTQYLTALTAYSIYCEQPACRQSKKPIKIFIPVNLRHFFKSDTLRNFSLYIKATFDGKKQWTLDDMLNSTREQFEQQLTKEDLQGRINSNVGIEKNMAIRLIPLFIKNLAFRMSYYYLAENINTIAISNLGRVTLPECMEQLVNDLEFCIGGTSIAVASYKGWTNICMSTEYKDLSMIQFVVQHLTQAGVPVTIDTNYREGYDELL